MKKQLLFFAIVSCLFSCDKVLNNEIEIGPHAAFSVDDSSIETFDTVSFTNNSSNVSLSDSTFTWYFEGGSPSISYETSPKVVYENVGSFKVKLIVSSGGKKDSIVKSSYIQVVSSLDNQLIAYYPFNGNANDESGNEQHGETYNTQLTYNRFAQQNKAYSFNGYNSFIEILPKLNVLTDYTLSVWAKTTGWKTQSYHDPQYIFDDHTTGKEVTSNWIRPGIVLLYIRYPDSICVMAGNLYSSTNPRDAFCRLKTMSYYSTYLSQWHNIILTRKSGVVSLYIDNIIVNQSIGSAKNDNVVLSGPIFIGTAMGNNPYYAYNVESINFSFKGSIDDVRLYSRALSANERSSLLRMEE